MTVEDPAKRVLLQGQLDVFVECIRNGGGNQCVIVRTQSILIFTNADGD